MANQKFRVIDAAGNNVCGVLFDDKEQAIASCNASNAASARKIKNEKGESVVEVVNPHFVETLDLSHGPADLDLQDYHETRRAKELSESRR